MDHQLTNEGKNSINRQNIESVLTLSETGGKLTLIELSIAEKMHCFSRHVLLTEQVKGKLNESEGLGAQFKLAAGRDGRLPSHFVRSSFLARYRWRPRLSFESTERCQVKSNAIETDKNERKTGP